MIQTILYTMPNCGICNMMKIKLHEKNIPFQEKPLIDYYEQLQIERAPVLQIGDQILSSPIEINTWINKQ